MDFTLLLLNYSRQLREPIKMFDVLARGERFSVHFMTLTASACVILFHQINHPLMSAHVNEFMPVKLRRD
jgi:hypothetical protein